MTSKRERKERKMRAKRRKGKMMKRRRKRLVKRKIVKKKAQERKGKSEKKIERKTRSTGIKTKGQEIRREIRKEIETEKEKGNEKEINIEIKGAERKRNHLEIVGVGTAETDTAEGIEKKTPKAEKRVLQMYVILYSSFPFLGLISFVRIRKSDAIRKTNRKSTILRISLSIFFLLI